MAQFSLEQALAGVKLAFASNEWGKAEATLRAILDQLPASATRVAFAHIIYSLTKQERFNEASTLLKNRLVAEPVMQVKEGSEGSPRVAILIGLQEPNLIVRSSDPDSFSFEINSGHYKVIDVFAKLDCTLHQVFITPDCDVDALANKFPAPAPDIIVNTIADGELEDRSLERAGRLLQHWNSPVINPPALVAPTGRDEVAEKLRDLEDLHMPLTLRWRQRADLPLPGDDFDWSSGVLIRAVGTQTAVDMVCHTSPDSIESFRNHAGGSDLFLTQFRDFQSADGYYRKYRLFAIGGNFYPEHLLISDTWNIHSADRLRLMINSPAMQEEEQAYLNDPENAIGAKNFSALTNVINRFDLDYFGIDFTILKNGRTMIFEANPAMRINLDFIDRFPYQSPALDRILEAFRTMVTDRLAG